MNSITPVILSGGSGTRLWPLSREAHPKQFLPVIGAHSLLQATALRLRGLSAQAPIVVANESHRFLVAEQLHAIGLPAGALLLEPVAKPDDGGSVVAPVSFDIRMTKPPHGPRLHPTGGLVAFARAIGMCREGGALASWAVACPGGGEIRISSRFQPAVSRPAEPWMRGAA